MACGQRRPTPAYLSKLPDPFSHGKSIVTTPRPSCCSGGVNCSCSNRLATRHAPTQRGHAGWLVPYRSDVRKR
jgi:hypothetical protein